MKGLRFLLLCGAVIAAGCDGGVRSPDFLAETTIESLSIKEAAAQPDGATAANLPVGRRLQLEASATTSTTVPPGTSGATTSCGGQQKPAPVICSENVDVTDEVSWSSADPSKATVDAHGLVTGKSAGKVLIRAALGGKTATKEVTVSSPVLTGIEIKPSSATIPDGSTQVFTVEGTYSDQVNRPLASSDGTVNWTSSNPAVATVTTPGFSSTATAQGPGTTTITATLVRSSGNLTDTATLTVSSATLTRVLRIRPATANVIVGGTTEFVAVGQYSNGDEADIPDSQIAWTSSNATVATIDANGVATGEAQGSVTITATASSATGTPNSATAQLNVTDNVCTSPLLSTAGAEAVVETNMACLSCSVADEGNAIDNDPLTAATMSLQLGLLMGEVSLTAVQQENLPLITSGQPAGFLISLPAGMPLSAEVLNQLRVATVRREGEGFVEVESSSIENTVRLTLLGQVGGVDTALVSVPTTAGKDYEGVRVALTSGVATLLATVNVNSSCATATPPPAPPAPAPAP